MKKRIFMVFMAVFMLSLIAIVSAAHTATVTNFATSYGPGDLIQGILNLKLSGESTDTALTATFDDIVKSVSLKDFLNSSGISFICTPSDCSTRYTAGFGATSETLPAGTSYLAFVIEKGSNVQISSLSFDITGNGGTETCGVSPVDIDILDDNSTDWEYTEPSDNLCYDLSPSKNYDVNAAGYDTILTDSPNCEKMTLEKSGRYRLGADITNGSNDKVHLSIIDADKNLEEGCDASPSNGIISCDVNFTGSDKKDYYVCVSSTPSSNHVLKSEIESPTCGYGFSASEDFYPFKCNDTLTDYAIYAAPMKIKAFGNTTTFNQDEFSKFNSDTDLSSYLQSYIDSKYGGSCNGSCIIPVRLNLNQQITLSNLSMKYSATGLGTSNQQKFYTSNRIPATMDMNQTQLSLSDSGITVPSEYGTYDFGLKIGTDEIKSSSIKVAQVPVISSLTPLDIGALISQDFSAVVTSPVNNSIVLYEWNYGDDSSDTTTAPFTNHSYPIGNFQLTLTVTDSAGFSSTRTFALNAFAPKDFINSTLQKKRGNINAMNTLISKIPSWYADIISSRINLNKMSSDLAILESDFKSPDADYGLIKTSLDSFVTYTAINDDDIGSSPVSPTINLNYLSALGESVNESNSGQITSELNAWSGNIGMNANYVVQYAAADTSPDNNLDLATILTVTLTPTKPLNNVYFVLILPEGVSGNDTRINGNYNVQDLNGALGFTFDTLNSTAIEIALPGRQLNLGMFSSPTLSNLVVPNVQCGDGICESGENYNTCPQDCRQPIWIPIFWGALVWAVVAGGIYWIWKYYAKRYDLQQQEKLFKEKADYVKLTSFIAEELNKGSSGKEIRKELDEAGWKNDQIEYAMSKVLKQTIDFQRQTVLNFIIDEKNSGKVDSEIKEQLKKAGWNSKLVDWAFRKFSRTQMLHKRKRF